MSLLAYPFAIYLVSHVTGYMKSPAAKCSQSRQRHKLHSHLLHRQFNHALQSCLKLWLISENFPTFLPALDWHSQLPSACFTALTLTGQLHTSAFWVKLTHYCSIPSFQLTAKGVRNNSSSLETREGQNGQPHLLLLLVVVVVVVVMERVVTHWLTFVTTHVTENLGIWARTQD